MMMLAQQHFTRPTFYNQQPQPQQQSHLEIDPVDSDSITSSPHSTQSSLLSQYSANFPNTFDSVPSAVPRRSHSAINNNFKFQVSSSQQSFDQNLSQVPDLMPSEPWMLQQHGQQQTPRTALRLGHQRESSLTSSLGSTGPASPYNANTSNPQIAVTDSSSDGFHDMGAGDNNYSYQLGKPLPMTDHFASLQNFAGHGIATSDTLFAHGLPNVPVQQQPRHKPKVDRITDLLPAPELSTGSGTRSQPGSVASSVVGADSPATPSFHEPEDDGRRRKNVFNTNQHPPKLDRTMTDIYSDELYSPNFTITSASPPPQTQMAISPSSDLFAQRLQAANSQHLSAAQSPVSATSRHQSPFRHGSPLAPSMSDFSQANQVRMNSAQQVRERRKAEQDAQALQQQIAHSGHQQQGTPSTISPKDAMLEFNEAGDDSSNFPLFPQQESHSFNSIPQQQNQAYQSATTPIQSNFNFNMPTNIQIPQRYPFIAHQQQQVTPATSNFSRVGSTETDGSDGSIQRPARTAADGGTYTCTYHGCTLRFDTPALLQKHKREGHRQANALNSRPSGVPSPGVPGNFIGSQAGPHRCDRINPSTGKPCNTVFSRPYDLTRHEDTIHNARKQKVRCNLCTEEKTFSRADALTRHYRVCHPDVEFAGKHRRRGGSH